MQDAPRTAAPATTAAGPVNGGAGFARMMTDGGAVQQAKLVLLGDMGAGKSSLVLRFVKVHMTGACAPARVCPCARMQVAAHESEAKRVGARG